MTQNNRKTLLVLFLALATPACIFLFVPETFAAEISTGRKIWNNVMLWVNFGILVFLFIKYAKKPLVDHLKSVRASIKKDLDEVSGELDDARTRMTAEEEKMKAVDERIREIRQALLEQGELDKEKIIEDAKLNAEKMVQDAKAYAEYRMTLARKALADEMVDMAVGIAEERIAEGITDTDHDNLVNQFIDGLVTAKPIDR